MNEKLKINGEGTTEIKPENEIKRPVFDMPTEEKSDVSTKTKEEDIKKINSTKERILKFFGNSPEKFMKKGEARMETNPKIKAMYNEVEKTDPERAQKLKMALGRYEYSKWDTVKNDYVDAGRYTESVNK